MLVNWETRLLISVPIFCSDEVDMSEVTLVASSLAWARIWWRLVIAWLFCEVRFDASLAAVV